MQELNHKPASWLTNLFIFHYLSTSEFMAAHAIIARDSASLKTSVLSYALATAAESMYHPLVSYIWRSHVSNSGKSLQTLNPSNGVCIAILDTAARYADVGLATDVMRVLGGRSTALFAHHYEALIDMYLAADELKAAFTTFGIMAKSSHPVTDGTTRSLLLWLSNDPTRPELALALIRSQAEALGQVKGMGTNVIPVAVMNAIMEAQLAEPSLSTPVAMETFHSLSTFSPPIKPTLQTFNSILRGIGLSRRKNSKASAMYIVTQMLESQITPDMLTYDRLILVCVASEEERLGEEEKLYEMGEDNLGDAYRYLEEMKEQNWWPRGGTAAKLVRLSVIAGDDRAWALLHDMRTVGIDLSKVENWAYSYAANRRVTQESD